MKKQNKKAKPTKKADKELWSLVESKIQNTEYVFSLHARKRQHDRAITDIDVLDILENKSRRNRKRNKKKDEYRSDKSDWNYCIEGVDLNKNKIRIIISFNNNLMLMITVIRID
jgi:hypothetical protein